MRIVDLTLPINRHMAGIPGVREYIENPTRCVVLSAFNEGHLEKIKASGLETIDDVEITHHMMSRLEIVGHIGTHIDAPLHFIEDTWSIDEVPLDKTIGKGRIIPLTDVAPGSAVTADMVLAAGVDFDDSVIPVLHTGWTDRAWGTDRFWDEMVWLDVSVSELMLERGVKAVALDFFPEAPFWNGIFRGDGKPGPNHRMLLGNKTIIIQMLTNIGDIGAGDFTLAGIPLLLEGLDGSPARVFAMTE